MAPKRATRSTPGTKNLTTTTVTNAQLQAMIDQGVTAALVARDANRNGDDSHTSGTPPRPASQKNTLTSPPHQTSQNPHEHAARECTYPGFPEHAKSNLRLVSCMDYWHSIDVGGNSYVKTTTPEVAHAMPWKTLKKMMTDKYCLRGEIKKIEFEMLNLKVKESNKVEKYVGGLPDMIHGSVMATKSKTMQDAIEFATELMDKKISTLAERQAENKRKLYNNNQTQQQLSKRQNVAQAYAAGTGERK
ncbi:hypothetical protein Tco_0293955 [Tanacetum coccineum]